MRGIFVIGLLLSIAALSVGAYFWPPAALGFVVVAPLGILGLKDMLQTKHAVLRNFPILGHGRYLLEMIRPEINQYFIESDTDGTPFNREERSLVYQRSKGQLDTVPFGTQRDLYEVGYEWINHSIMPVEVPHEEPRVLIGKNTCKKPYELSLLNISAMSFGSLSSHSVMALNLGAKAGKFAHNTGEGGISDHHLQGGDLIWQIGTGYFGCRSKDGGFDPERFQENASKETVRMIEVKISQGAKPGHGGILPARKLTPEIAQIRGVPMGQDVLSPPSHKAFSTPIELLEFLTKLRELSGGKPVGFKLCIGKRREFLAICKAMIETGMCPDYVAVDGAEGGTGAAPLEFSNTLGCPLTEGLIFVHNSLKGAGLRQKVKVIASGKIVSGFDMARVLAIGADACYSARGMMMSLGCIQARRCNANDCPVGVATQKPNLVVGLVVDDKAPRVARYHDETVHSFLELMTAAGVAHPDHLMPWHVVRRIGPTQVAHYGELFEYLDESALLNAPLPESFARAWDAASASSFQYAPAR